MAKKKRKPGDDQSRKPDPKGPLGKLPDRRAMERVMRQLMSGGPPEVDTPQSRAQALLDQAFATGNLKRRAQLAHEALELWPDCADAYVLLAENAPTRKQTLALYEQAVSAGERALGPEPFRRDVGHFWGLLETRPYMRARLGLALLLWKFGRRDEAVQHLQDMLRLNPGDNQGVRYTLSSCLLYLDRDVELARLLDQYPGEASAAWAYTRALLAFRTEGDTAESRRLLAAAKKANAFIPDYLLGRKTPPPEQLDHYSLGAESEAVIYVSGNMGPWKDTAGAIAWLRSLDEKTAKRKADIPRPKGPLGFIKNWLKEHLPQEPDVWQADFRQAPTWIQIGGAPVRPWAVLVVSHSTGLVLAHQLGEEEPSPALLWDTLVQAMQHPAAGPPHRPTELWVPPESPWESLAGHLEEIGVTLSSTEELDHLDEVFGLLGQHLGGQERSSLLELAGVTPELLGRFYEAAASFFRHMPWKKLAYESPIRIESKHLSSGPYYGIIMGQNGLTAGLAVYENLKALQRLLSGRGTDEENARKTVGTSVTFGEEWELPVGDLDAIRDHGWPVARSDAYPAIFHKNRGASLRKPLPWEIELLTVALAAIPDLVARRRQDDPTREELSVPMVSGNWQVFLSWVPEEE